MKVVFAISVLLLLQFQYNDTVTEDLMSYVQQNYNNDTTFIFCKLTTFPILKGAAYYWNYYSYSSYCNENIIYKLGNSYIVGIRFTFYGDNEKIYLYQAEQYENELKQWIIKRKTKICVNAFCQSEILLYNDEKF